MREPSYGADNRGDAGSVVEACVETRLQETLARTAVIQRESSRAGRMQLKVRPPGSVELVVPRGTSSAQRLKFLSSQLDWIVRTRTELGRRYRGDRNPVPAEIDLPALGRRWNVVLQPETPALLCMQAGEAPCLVLRSSEPVATLQLALRRWLMQQAREALLPWLGREGLRLGMQPRRRQVRLQRTRWGSCSSRGTISLNARALFLPPEAVRYLLVHELCHLRYMRHSPRYWALVERFEPDYLRLDACLTRSWERIPAWAAPG